MVIAPSHWRCVVVELRAILTSRTAYEYAADEIRLSLICQQSVIDYLKERFNFQAAEVAMPPESFGPVAQTLPPGLILANGGFTEGEGMLIPIRAILIDSRRVVVDVAGPTTIAQTVFDHIGDGLAGLRAPDDRPVLGQPRRSRTYSELTVRSSGISRLLTDAPIQRALRKHLSPETVWGNDVPASVDPIVSIRMKGIPGGTEYPGAGSTPDAATFMLDVRGGSTLDEALIYSIAPLDTDSHLTMLTELERHGSPE